MQKRCNSIVIECIVVNIRLVMKHVILMETMTLIIAKIAVVVNCVHFECTCVLLVQSLSIEESDILVEETVTRIGYEGPNASVLFARWQESLHGGGYGAIHSAGGFAGAA